MKRCLVFFELFIDFIVKVGGIYAFFFSYENYSRQPTNFGNFNFSVGNHLGLNQTLFLEKP